MGDRKADLFTVTFYNKYDMEEEDVQDKFSEFGKIIHCNCINQRYFIRYADKSEAEAALDKYRNKYQLDFAKERGDRGNRGDRGERSGGKSDNPRRNRFQDVDSDRPSRDDQSDRFTRDDRSDRPSRDDRSDRPNRNDRSDRPNRDDRSDRPNCNDRSDRPNRDERFDRPSREDRSDRPSHEDRSDRPNRNDDGRSEKPNWDNRSDRPRRDDRSDKLNPGDRPDRPRINENSRFRRNESNDDDTMLKSKFNDEGSSRRRNFEDKNSNLALSRNRKPPDLVDAGPNEMGGKFVFIVGNLPPKFTTDDVYNLVAETNPMYVGKIDETLKAKLNFCAVHVDTEEKVLHLTNKLDGFLIGGNKLIAMESSQLKDEAEPELGMGKNY